MSKSLSLVKIINFLIDYCNIIISLNLKIEIHHLTYTIWNRIKESLSMWRSITSYFSFFLTWDISGSQNLRHYKVPYQFFLFRSSLIGSWMNFVNQITILMTLTTEQITSTTGSPYHNVIRSMTISDKSIVNERDPTTYHVFELVLK